MKKAVVILFTLAISGICQESTSLAMPVPPPITTSDSYNCDPSSNGLPTGYCSLTTANFSPTVINGWYYPWNKIFIAVAEPWHNSQGQNGMQFIPATEAEMNHIEALVYTLWSSNSKAVFIFDSRKCSQDGGGLNVVRCPLAAITAAR